VQAVNTMHVEDFVVLGRTVPEESKKFGKRICMAGYSTENNQFLRVYPLLVPVGENADVNGFRARYRYTLDLQRNPQDSRTESWRVIDEKNPTSTDWGKAPEVSKNVVTEWLERRAVDSIRALNQCRQSIGVLYVPRDKWEGFAVAREQADPAPEHNSLFEDLADQPRIDANLVRYAPYIQFDDADGRHRLQVREWGAYILLANPKYADRPDSLWSASGYRKGKDLLLVIGNMSNHRTNWLVIKTFEMDSDPGLFDDVE
jgi:hypothetical protein